MKIRYFQDRFHERQHTTTNEISPSVVRRPPSFSRELNMPLRGATANENSLFSGQIIMNNQFGLAGPDSRFQQSDSPPAGFWAGYWHGLMAPIAFVVSLFRPGVRVYETRNNGTWYDFGFILGASASLGGGVKVKIDKRSERPSNEAG
jgi:hypothetical protein